FPGSSVDSTTVTHPPNVCYRTPGSYDVTLIATNANGSDTLTIPNYITVYPYSPQQSILQNGDTLFSNTGFVIYQWFYSGDTIPGATNSWYLALQSGDYSVVCLDSNGCSVEVVLEGFFVSVGEADGKSLLHLYPNPADRILTFRLIH